MMRPAVGRGDPWLLLPVLLLAPIGLLMLLSASGGGADGLRPGDPAARQAVLTVAGVAIMLTLARLDYHWLRTIATPAYATTLVLLMVVLAAGVAEFGARRWLGAAGVTFQPSELAKPALVIALAAYASGREPRPPAVLGALGLLAVPLALVVMQPDAGTALVLGGASLAISVAWGVRWRALGMLTVAAVALTPLLFAMLVPAYQRERIAVFLDPARDPLGSGFDLQLAEAAIRSGGLTGRGVFAGRSALDGVGAGASDFMLARTAEALGLLGAALVVALLCLLVWRGLRAARMAPDAFGRLLATGLTATVFVQAFVHVAVNVRLFPATGIPLPLVSQGGSSLLAMYVAAGLLLSVASQRPPGARERWSGERWR